MEFELTVDKKIEARKNKKGKEITYQYNFKGKDPANKSTLVLKTEKAIDFAEGAIIAADFKDIQAKIK